MKPEHLPSFLRSVGVVVGVPSVTCLFATATLVEPAICFDGSPPRLISSQTPHSNSRDAGHKGERRTARSAKGDEAAGAAQSLQGGMLRRRDDGIGGWADLALLASARPSPQIHNVKVTKVTNQVLERSIAEHCVTEYVRSVASRANALSRLAEARRPAGTLDASSYSTSVARPRTQRRPAGKIQQCRLLLLLSLSLPPTPQRPCIRELWCPRREP